MNELYTVSRADLVSLLPELILSGAGVLLLLIDAFFPRSRGWQTPFALVATAAAAVTAWRDVPAGESFHGLLEWTPLSAALTMVLMITTGIALAGSRGYLRREGLRSGEYCALVLWCAAGLVLLVRATELLTIFLALELLSVCLYCLAGYHRRLAVATEAAIKYFLMGAFASSFILYGIALLFGETGSTRLEAIGVAVDGGAMSPLASLGLVLLIAGFGFKMSVVPFHAWSPDTYQGAPSPFVAMLSVAPKAASAMVLIRLIDLVAPGVGADRWTDLIAILAAASMIVGNLLALSQRDIKRMLAYSGIGHMGYLLIPLASPDPQALIPIVVYLLAYALTNAAAFVLVAMLFTKAGEQHLIADLSGWGYRYPVLAACLTVCMLSLGGIPPTVGFIGKYLVFVHALGHGRLWLAVLGVVTSLIGVFYYLRVVYVMYMQPAREEVEAPGPDLWGRVAALAAGAAILVLGVWPGRLLAWLERSLTGL